MRPGGLLLYQSWQGPGGGGRPGPASPDHRLLPGELPDLFPTLEVLLLGPADGDETWMAARAPR